MYHFSSPGWREMACTISSPWGREPLGCTVPPRCICWGGTFEMYHPAHLQRGEEMWDIPFTWWWGGNRTYHFSPGTGVEVRFRTYHLSALEGIWEVPSYLVQGGGMEGSLTR